MTRFNRPAALRFREFASPAVAGALAVLVFGSEPVQADPLEDVCHARARSESGYRAPLEYRSPDGRSKVRLGGSVALGGSSSRGAASAGGGTPAFAGAASSERREKERTDKQAAKYQRIYDTCIGDR